ncbi:MAG TPA: DUF4956 domain-containing protein [Gemmatimonadaceae bacterium]|nr:DUF4956 domain-containing protein [Gemmatimonadaceae bacterium]
MENRPGGSLRSPATRVLLKVVAYYAVLIPLGWLVLDKLPAGSSFATSGFQPILGDGIKTAAATSVSTAPHPGGAVAVAAAMMAAILLSLPVAWVYQLTRAKRGYQQSVVQLLIILPLVVAGVVILVKNSLALAFSLAGIVAAVRFRNSLDDSKDAVYVFLATGVGLAAAVDIPMATVISMLFNVTVLLLWYTDFGNSPIELEGSIAAKRLKRAKELARTGTFVAQIDNEVLRNMNREQLEGLAQKALRRARGDGSKADESPETCLRVRTRDSAGTRRGLELVLGEFAREWRTGGITIDPDGVATIDYFIRTKKTTQPDELVTLARTAGGSELVDAEIR